MKKILIGFVFFFCVGNSFSQKSEIGGFFGASFYMGDLNPATPFAQSKFAGGIVYRYNIDPRWAVKGSIIFGNVEASDQKTNNNNPRNLSFKSPITEISAQVELNFLRLFNERGKNFFSPYIFGGISVFSFNPRAELDGTYYDLQHLGTEGQGLKGEKKFYSLTNCAIPFGIGVKFNFARYFSISAEWGMRYTFTDYLDDVSGVYYDNQTLAMERGPVVAGLADKSVDKHRAGEGRGNVKTKDWYSFAGLLFTFKIGNADKTCDIRSTPKRSTKIRVNRK